MTGLDISNCDDANKKEILKVASDLRKFEIERFWSRSLFFWGFITTAFGAYGFATRAGDRFQFAAACFGFLTALAWSLLNRGSKYWQEAWEQKVEAVEMDVLKTNLFSNKEPIKPGNFWLKARRYSPSKLATALSDIVTLAWLALVIHASGVVTNGQVDCTKVVIALASGVGLWLLLIKSRSSD